MSNIIEFHNVGYTYPRSTRAALQGVDLTIEEGDFVAILGESGSGKSSLAQCAVGIIPHLLGGHFNGEVTVAGLRMIESSIAQLVDLVGYVFQDADAQLFGLRVEETIAFGMENMGMPREQMVAKLKELAVLLRIEHLMRKHTSELSGGEKQACAIAAVLAMGPEVIILDDPTSPLDPVGKQRIRDIILDLNKKMGKTVILIDRESDWVATVANKVCLMKDGQLVQIGSPSRVFSDPATVEETGVAMPQLADLYLKLRAKGYNLNGLFLTYDEAKETLAEASILERLRCGSAEIAHHKLGKSPPGTGKPIISLRNLSFSYDHFPALRDINLDVFPGEVVALVGQNGSGKTTLAKHIIGLLKPGRGTVQVMGQDVAKASTAELARQVGYVFQNPDRQLFEATLLDEVAYGLKIQGDVQAGEKAQRILELFDLTSLADESPFSLSMGQKQRIAIASALVTEPNILILDEPVEGLDERNRRVLIDLIRKLHRSGKTIILISHDMNFVAKCSTRVVILQQGRILADGETREIFANPNLFVDTSLRLPLVTALALEGGCAGVLTVEEFVNNVEAALS
ncbi:MAG: energy-coupling factor transporter ATPase [Chloroflexi bacterium]|nr:energy-coupling factor transporter ATPase [Chloroflexota bacterium]